MNNSLNCDLCQHPLHIFNIDDDDYEYVLPNGFVLYNQSTEMGWACCTNCPTFYNLCGKCSFDDENNLTNPYFCKFLGHDDFTKLINDSDSSEDDDETPFKSFQHFNKRYIHQPDIRNGENNSLTGDDGGYYHYWKCHNCNTTHKLTDK